MPRQRVYPIPKTIEAELGLALRLERERQGLSRYAIAVGLGRSESCLAYWEHGTPDHRPSLTNLILWAAELDMDLNTSLTKKED